MVSAHNNTITSGKVSETQGHIRGGGGVSFCCHSSVPRTSSLRDWILLTYRTTLQPDNEVCQGALLLMFQQPAGHLCQQEFEGGPWVGATLR